MAEETKRIVIELKAAGSVSDSSGTSGTSSGDSGDLSASKYLSTLLHPIRSAEQYIGSKGLGGHVAVQAAHIAVNAVKNAGMYYLNRYLSLTENYQAEQDLSNTMTAISKAASLIGTVGAGAMGGMATGGPVGAAVGAVVAAVGWTVNETIDLVKTYDQQEISINEANGQSAFQSTRLGLSNGGRGTEN